MLFKVTLFASVIVSVVSLAVAAPPACLLACVNKQPEVQDYKAICGTNAAKVEQCLKNECAGDVYQTAVDNYTSSCKDAGVAVSIPTSSPTTITSASIATKTATGATGATESSSKSASATTATGTYVHNGAHQSTVSITVAFAAIFAGVIIL